MKRWKLPNGSKHTVATLSLALLLVAVWSFSLLKADGNQLLNRSLTLGDSQPGKTTVYDFKFQPVGLDTLESIVLEVCANNPFPGTPCTPPSGFDASNATLASQSGDTGFSISGSSTANRILLTRPPLTTSGDPDEYSFTNIVNPSNQGSYYVRLQTFATPDGSGINTNYGGLAFAINSGVDINATVPPYLLFCVGISITAYDCNTVVGDYVDFGELSSTLTSQGFTQMLVATNAKNGYAIRVNGTTLTSGNNVITALANDVSRRGVNQFGMNLRANSTPAGGNDPTGPGSGSVIAPYNQTNFFRFNTGDAVAGSPTVDAGTKYTVSYIVNVAKGQSPGVYVSTLTYIALGNF